MPVSLSYPGVYIEEVPSSVRTIAGVSTSVTAFVGACLKGPVDTPVTITSYADFERTFGGLGLEKASGNSMPLGFAVRDFYLNGGSQAIIVRIHTYSNNTTNADIASVDLEIFPAPVLPEEGEGLPTPIEPPILEKLTLVAANPGIWGNNLGVIIVPQPNETIANNISSDIDKVFNLTIVDKASGETEVFNNVSIDPLSTRPVNIVLANASKLARVSGDLPSKLPAETTKEDGEYQASPFLGGSDGTTPTVDRILGSQANKTGIYALEKTDIFNLLCVPGFTDLDTDALEKTQEVIKYCADKRSFFIMDPSLTWDEDDSKLKELSLPRNNAALYYPSIVASNPLRDNQLEEFYPCGMVAGTIARIDGQRGIWKAPAGTEAGLSGVAKLSIDLNNLQIGALNQLGINCLRTMPAAGAVIWGARTLEGSDQLASQWKYIPVRRLALYIEESLYRGTQWAVFEPNDEPLWRQISLNLDSFMNTLFRQGAFQGQTKNQAYFVKCDKETTTQSDIDRGIVNILVGFAPLKPAEFVVIKLQQIAGQQ